jgi:trimethylamine-N-oxide reductase (cytochrome c) cytochrome c-type subunit TorY
MAKQSKENGKKSRPRFLGSKKGVVLFSLPVLLVVGLSSHEVAVRYFPNITCVACHEMKDPVKRWRDSGVAKNHPNCADCHFDPGIARVWEMNREAAVLFVKHFRRSKEEPIRPPEAPIFIDPAKEPAYYSLVPNHRCFSCKDAKNHKPMEQAMVHRKLLSFGGTEPCKDCHNHDMRNGMKFYERVLPDQNAPGTQQEASAAGSVRDSNAPGTAGEALAQN